MVSAIFRIDILQETLNKLGERIWRLDQDLRKFEYFRDRYTKNVYGPIKFYDEWILFNTIRSYEYRIFARDE
jgi:hypothetical protein